MEHRLSPYIYPQSGETRISTTSRTYLQRQNRFFTVESTEIRAVSVASRNATPSPSPWTQLSIFQPGFFNVRALVPASQVTPSAFPPWRQHSAQGLLPALQGREGTHDSPPFPPSFLSFTVQCLPTERGDKNPKPSSITARLRVQLATSIILRMTLVAQSRARCTSYYNTACKKGKV